MDRFYYQSFAIPANTQQNAPVSFPFPLEDATLKHGAITVPDGHNGFTGIRVLWGTQQIWPWSNNQFVVANGRTIPIGFDDYITISGLIIEAFNTDIFNHTFYMELTISDLPSQSGLAANAGPSAAILPPKGPSSTDPLSPDALIASVPPEAITRLISEMAA